MIPTLYIEEEIAGHPRVQTIASRLPKAEQVACGRYGEVFNPKAQSFRLQKARSALILARKHSGFVLPTPEGYGIGGENNYYFSHLLNCPYDCRYCFLQGMYRSAHQVLFVNYEDFFAAIEAILAQHPGEDCTFFSGYDGDSLAFEGITGFAAAALAFFRRHPRAWLELRTKSTHVAPLLEVEPFPNAVVAFSFTPEEISAALEHGVPSVERRLRALAQVAQRGWPVGLRFDPLIYQEDFLHQYEGLFRRVFETVSPEQVHSASLGPFRLPTGFFKTVRRLYPEEPLFAGQMEKHGGMVSYPRALEEEMVSRCSEALLRYISPEAFFPCPLPEPTNAS